MRGAVFVSVVAIVASLASGVVTASTVWSDDFQDRTSRDDFRAWTPLTPKGGDVFIALGANNFLTGVTSGGSTIGAARPSPVAYGQVGYSAGVGEAFPQSCSPEAPNAVGLTRFSGNVGNTNVVLAGACVGPIDWASFNVIRVTRDRFGGFEFCLNGRTVLRATDNTIQTSTYFTVQIGQSADFDDFVIDDTVLPCQSGVACLSLPATIVGTEGDDVLVGTRGPDVMNGLGGDDVLEGGDGNDVMCGGAGDDLLEAGWGDDLMAGDYLIGTSGDDVLRGGDDILRGGPGMDFGDGDYLQGLDGNDDLQGGDDILEFGPGGTGALPPGRIFFSGGDMLFGDNGDDHLQGGDDLLLGGSGADTWGGDQMPGGAGNDVVMGGDDVLIGGAGNDWMVGESAGGGPGNDVVVGGDDYLDGGPGDDVLAGDPLIGGPGDDLLIAGDDVLIGGPGNEIIFRGDEIHADVAFGGGVGIDTVILGDDTLIAGPGDDPVDGDWVIGVDQPGETISGGDDLIHCGPGVDTANGGPGTDVAIACEATVDVEVNL